MTDFSGVSHRSPTAVLIFRESAGMAICCFDKTLYNSPKGCKFSNGDDTLPHTLKCLLDIFILYTVRATLVAVTQGRGHRLNPIGQSHEALREVHETI